MIEKRTKVTPYKIDAVCNHCDEGVYIPTEVSKAVNPPIYEHKCDRCGDTRGFREVYPIIKYEEVG